MTILPLELDELVKAKKSIECRTSDPGYTICEFTRVVYRDAENIPDPELRDRIKRKMIEIHAFAKRMNKSLGGLD